MKHLLIYIVLLSSVAISSGQTATDFAANDCSGTPHHLYAELAAGKVIVIAFVMPCTACVAPSQASYTSVQGYASSFPGRVVFYIVDDNADTSCDTITAWAAANGLSTVPCFSTAAFISSQYGGAAMPKIVVLGGTNDSVYFVQNNAVEVHNLQAAIDAALMATAVAENNNNRFDITVFPNPASAVANVSYSLQQATDVSITLSTIAGAELKREYIAKQAAGKHSFKINTDNLTEGNYFIKIDTKEGGETIKFTMKK